MEIGNQIKQLRLRRGITQETMAQYLGVTAQAVSKWERGSATPDIAMLPAISAYFGVSIDELFALSDDTRMERIQNMIWDVRYFDPADVQKEKAFLLDKAKREPENDRVYELLADMENHLAKEHRDLAAEYAKEGLSRNPDSPAVHACLVEALGGQFGDWFSGSYFELINFYLDFVEAHPESIRGYLWLMDHLLLVGRVDEAEAIYARFCKVDSSYRVLMYRGILCWYRGQQDEAFAIWEQMKDTYPNTWHVYYHTANMLTRAGRYEEAKAHYRKAMSVQDAPAYCDSLESIIQICEIQKNYQEAIDVCNEELQLIEQQWHTTTGETVDVVIRNRERLANKL